MKTRAYQLTDSERDCVLAALRLWQRYGPGPAEIQDIATNGGKHECLGLAGIDALCERLNVFAKKKKKGSLCSSGS